MICAAETSQCAACYYVSIADNNTAWGSTQTVRKTMKSGGFIRYQWHWNLAEMHLENVVLWYDAKLQRRRTTQP